MKKNKKNNQFKSSISWSFTNVTKSEVAAYACNFDKPFWDVFDVDGDVRRIKVKGTNIEIVEHKQKSSKTGYTYTAMGVPGIAPYRGKIKTDQTKKEGVTLGIKVAFRFLNGSDYEVMTNIVGGYFNSAETALKAHFKDKFIG